MVPKLAAVADALDSGVEAVHILDGRVPHSVLIEIFTETGIGTKITA
jgi:acetylglutamate kinase